MFWILLLSGGKLIHLLPSQVTRQRHICGRVARRPAKHQSEAPAPWRTHAQSATLQTHPCTVNAHLPDAPHPPRTPPRPNRNHKRSSVVLTNKRYYSSRLDRRALRLKKVPIKLPVLLGIQKLHLVVVVVVGNLSLGERHGADAGHGRHGRGCLTGHARVAVLSRVVVTL